ncbi:hypothetical protein GCM10027517_20110 [Phycicoccus ginsengisoli]
MPARHRSHLSHRPLTERVVLAVLLFLGITATAGGAAFVAAQVLGLDSWFPREWLDRIPLIDNWVVPGLVLGLGFGVGSFVARWGLRTRVEWGWTRGVRRLTGRHWSWLASVLLGLGQVVWIGLELVWIPFSFFHVIYGAVGLLLLLLPFTPSMRGDLARRSASEAPRVRGRERLSGPV